MKRRIFALITGSLFAFSGFAQEQVVPCGTDEALHHLHEQFPALKAEFNARLLENSKEVTTSVNQNGVAQKTTNYIIPVVFHVLHMYGNERVSESSIYNLMEDLNEDYSATNPDFNQVIPMYDTIATAMGIEFRLAALDPFGNCTNGIEYIETHETYNGETVSKINQWDRSHYLNIWVVNEPNSGGTVQGTLLGYATLPEGTDGSGFWTDGIVLRDWTVTSNDRTLTHEAGHYFGLRHPFNGVATVGDPGECGDDGLADTPPTQGSFSTCNLNLATCDTSIAQLPLANVQNYMDYGSCSVMFTRDQESLTTNTLEGISGQRNVLWVDTTLMETGVLNMTMPQTALTVPLCAPIADFNADERTVCTGTAVSFQNYSFNAGVVDDILWTFEDGSPATSTSANPTVTWNTPGYKKVTLTVSNTEGSDTKTEDRYIYVSADWPDNYGIATFDMESATAPGTGTGFFVVQNPENNYGEFVVASGNGYDGSKAFKLQTFKDVSQADNYTADWFYNYRLGGSVDQLITPSIDLRNTSSVKVTFKFSYATNATISDDITEEFRVYSSKDCGESWTPRVVKLNGVTIGSTIDGDDLVTAGYASNSDFAPTSNAQWAEVEFDYTSNSQDRLTRFMFEFTASDLSSNLFIDNINITGVVGVEEQEIMDLDLMIYPNPTNGEAINVTYAAQDEPTEFILRDAQGKVVAHQVIDATNVHVSQQLNNTEDLPAACYFLEVKTGDYSTTKKVVVM